MKEDEFRDLERYYSKGTGDSVQGFSYLAMEVRMRKRDEFRNLELAWC